MSQLDRVSWLSRLIACRASWDYYRRHLRENFVSHSEETQSDRLQIIFVRAERDAEWVVNKVSACEP